MSILGVGIDMVKIHRFKKLFFLYGFKIINRILSQKEIIEFNRDKKENFLAKSFSAKEAFAKALGCGIFNKIFFKNCEIIHNKQGKPILIGLGKIKKFLKELRVKNIFLSITDTKKYVQSIVILEK